MYIIVDVNLTFILNVLSESNILPSCHWFLLKKMWVFSHEMVFIENQAALPCVTMWEHARAFAATIYQCTNQCTNFLYSFCH